MRRQPWPCLPFLGAGQTHKEGQYKDTVEHGLVFLIRSMKVGNGMGDLSDSGGKLYSHGMASIALCEAYAMTNDPELLQPAQFALNFIAYAQDPVGGGWRYEPKQAGDTSVVGWQLMACKSGHMAYLKVPRRTILGRRASSWIFVQEANGSQYGYTVPGAAPATTAVGLLCRMYLGWKHDEPATAGGSRSICTRWGRATTCTTTTMPRRCCAITAVRTGRSGTASCATGLVKAQDTKGHETGSWYFPSRSVGRSGRAVVLHVDGDHDSRSLLSPHADLWQTSGRRGFPAVTTGRTYFRARGRACPQKLPESKRPERPLPRAKVVGASTRRPRSRTRDPCSPSAACPTSCRLLPTRLNPALVGTHPLDTARDGQFPRESGPARGRCCWCSRCWSSLRRRPMN